MQMRAVPSKMLMDDRFRRMYYVRYADDFIIGMQCNRKEAVSILQNLSSWLMDNLKISLHKDKTAIRHFASQSIKFLGVTIGPIDTSARPVRLYEYETGKRQRITPRLAICTDIKALFKRLKDRGFVKFSTAKNTYVGIPYSRMQNKDIADIIRYFNTVFRGIWNYYAFTDNSSGLNHI